MNFLLIYLVTEGPLLLLKLIVATIIATVLLFMIVCLAWYLCDLDIRFKRWQLQKNEIAVAALLDVYSEGKHTSHAMFKRVARLKKRALPQHSKLTLSAIEKEIALMEK